MDVSKVVSVLAILLILAVVFIKCPSSKAGFDIPEVALFPNSSTLPPPERDARSFVGNDTFFRGPGSNTAVAVDYASMAVAPDQPSKDKAVTGLLGEYLNPKDFMPEPTIGGPRLTDAFDTRFVNVQMRSRKWEGINHWVAQPRIEKVDSIHRIMDVNSSFDRGITNYNEDSVDQVAARNNGELPYNDLQYRFDLRMI